MNIYKPHELQSTVINSQPKKSNIILGIIYRHSTMDLNQFNNKYVNKLLENNISMDNKTFLLGDFNIDLLKYESHTPTNEFLDSLTSNVILP